jgi:tRNA G18 (ribose-2'-O)-methylase SpoU
MELVVLLDNIRSAYNVGSVFRSCDSAGVDKLILTGYCAIPPNPKLQKTALGSIDNVAWEHHCDAISAIKYLKSQHIQIVCLETAREAQLLFDYHYQSDACLIFGNEEQGNDPRLLALADVVLKIPQYGVKESLNIASAAAVAIYEFRRQQPKIQP